MARAGSERAGALIRRKRGGPASTAQTLSGALVYAGPAGAPLGDEQFERLKAELEAGFQGTANAGRPLLLEGGLDWKPLSLSPRDMDFIEAKATAAREIALAFGVPPMLIGLPGDNTYANYAEANRSFWRQTVLPLAARTAQSLAHWLGPAWGGAALRPEPDLDRIDALAGERGELWARIGAASFLTDDEKRAAVGYGPRAGGGGQKGGWAGLDVVPGDTTVPGGAAAERSTGSSSGLEAWRNQPRVPAGTADGGQWTAAGSADVGIDPSPSQGSHDWPIDTASAFDKDQLNLSIQAYVSLFCLARIRSVMPG